MDRAPKVASSLVALVECYVSVEILWSVLNPGEPRLYELAIEQIWKLRERLEYRLQVLSTLQSIRRLPE
jgi:hypothetical protein